MKIINKKIMIIVLGVLVALAFMPQLSAQVYAASKQSPAKVSQYTPEVNGDTSLIIKWKKVKSAKKYQVAYYKSGESHWKNWKYKTVSASKDSTEINLKLSPSTTYKTKVRAIGKSAKGTWSKTKSVRTNTKVIKVWNIGADSETQASDEKWSNGNSNVTAALDSDGCLDVKGAGNTLYGLYTSAGGNKIKATTCPWGSDRGYDVKSVVFGNDVSPTNLQLWFTGCKKLVTVEAIPSSVTRMDDTFAECTKLKKAPEIPEGVIMMIGTFSGCTSLKTAPTLPDGVQNINATFARCTSLTTAPTVPSSVQYIGYAFYDCEDLTGNILIKADIDTVFYNNYAGCFEDSATSPKTHLVVNYGGKCTTDIAQTLVNTKSKASHVLLGRQTVE